MCSQPAAIDLSDDMGQADWEPPQVWREGRKIVMIQGATLPDRCVKCNAEPEAERLKSTLYWHPPLLYLLIVFPGLLIYIIVALIVRKRAVVHVPLCTRHRALRRRLIGSAWLIVLAGLAGIGYAAVEENGAAVIVAIVVLLGGIIMGVVGSQTLSPAHIDKQRARLSGACKAYIETLPAKYD